MALRILKYSIKFNLMLTRFGKRFFEFIRVETGKGGVSG
jgi:hypothetical protein